jgi:hypothetical protein
MNDKRTTHTPGPWLCDRQTVYALNDEGQNRFVAGIQGGFTSITPRVRTEAGELDANARLIAAAPDLLAALKDCVGRFTEAFPAAEAYEPIQKALAAIASAESSS